MATNYNCLKASMVRREKGKKGRRKREKEDVYLVTPVRAGLWGTHLLI